jgi:acyl-CoA reductase-like NAD-dependent aldehyde dehydrogenase
MSTNRIIVDAKVHDEFVERFVNHVRTLKVGDPSDPGTVVGPIINSKQLANMNWRRSLATRALHSCWEEIRADWFCHRMPL